MFNYSTLPFTRNWGVLPLTGVETSPSEKMWNCPTSEKMCFKKNHGLDEDLETP